MNQIRLPVVDTETTGNQDHDQVLELAIVTVLVERTADPRPAEFRAACPWSPKVWGQWDTLIKPTTPCSFEARAVHHIPDSLLEGAPTMPELLASRGLPELDGDAIFVAQNAEFDLKLLKQSGVTIDNRVICTWRCAQHLWPDAPRYGNQVLRYWLGLDDKYKFDLGGLPPHRALADTLVTAHILLEMLRLKTPEELVALTATPIIHKKLRFGKWEGTPLEEVARRDRGYLQWILRQGPKRTENGKEEGFDADMLATARAYLGMPPISSLPQPTPRTHDNQLPFAPR